MARVTDGPCDRWPSSHSRPSHASRTLTPHLPPSFKGLGYFEEAKGGADKDGKAPPPKHKVLKIFRDMPERNHASLMLVYRRAAELFSKVEALIAKYRP